MKLFFLLFFVFLSFSIAQTSSTKNAPKKASSEQLQSLSQEFANIQKKGRVLNSVVNKLAKSLNSLHTSHNKPDKKVIRKLSRSIVVIIVKCSLDIKRCDQLVGYIDNIVNAPLYTPNEEISKGVEAVLDMLQTYSSKKINLKDLRKNLKNYVFSSRLRRYLSTFDEDQNGRLTSSEKVVLKSKMQSKRARKFLDLNGNKTVSRSEIRQANRELKSVLKQNRRNFLSQFDTNGDGRLSQSERRSIPGSGGQPGGKQPGKQPGGKPGGPPPPPPGGKPPKK